MSLASIAVSLTGFLLAGIWIWRLADAALGMRKVADISTPEWKLKLANITARPRVSIIVPARNEQEHIQMALRSLLALDYDNYEVIVINDRSEDKTGEIIEEIAADPLTHRRRLRVIHVRELPEGWMGKVHAMWTAASAATGEWLLFTDADVIFRPKSLRQTISYAQAENADHLVLLPHFIMKLPGEKMMLAFFQMLFVFGHRPWKVADPKSKDHMGVGAFNLVRRSVYEAVGTYKALRFEVLDDMKPGKVIKDAGFRQRNVYGADLISIRWAKGATGVIRNLTKNSFAILSFQWTRVVASCLVVAFLNLGPFIGLTLSHGWMRIPFAFALTAMFGIYVGMSWHSEVPFYYFVLHPISSVLFIYIMSSSMVLALFRGGIIWRGRFYKLNELKRGAV
jgi:cellulose synthase/poly-beta-1,6-N-acetylglucosamine synthase-like glycosyltransferase